MNATKPIIKASLARKQSGPQQIAITFHRPVGFTMRLVNPAQHSSAAPASNTSALRGLSSMEQSRRILVVLIALFLSGACQAAADGASTNITTITNMTTTITNMITSSTTTTAANPLTGVDPGAFLVVAPVLFATGDGDVLSALFHGYENTAAAMPMPLWWCFVRAAAAIELITILCALVFKSWRQSLSPGALMAINWIIFLLGWFFVAALPLGSLPISPAHKGWILAIALLAIAILPWRAAWFLVPRQGQRIIAGLSLYGLLIVLLLIQLLVA